MARDIEQFVKQIEAPKISFLGKKNASSIYLQQNISFLDKNVLKLKNLSRLKSENRILYLARSDVYLNTKSSNGKKLMIVKIRLEPKAVF